MNGRSKDFILGIQMAADIAAQYNASTTHPYRLEDCILFKLNVRKQKPRLNKERLESPDDAWTRGFVIALAESHRHIPDDVVTCEAAANAGITLTVAKKAGVDPYDWRELKKAGVPDK